MEQQQQDKFIKKVGPYKLKKIIGEGAFGTVYKAIKESTDQIFAVKQISRERLGLNLKYIKTEKMIMRMIKHPNILHMYDYKQSKNNYYLIIDYCDGGDFHNYIKKEKGLGEQKSIFYLMQIMNGFKELHRHQIMHRDFKPANVMLKDGRAVIGDLGLAKYGKERTGTVAVGTPIFMAPEVFNKGEQDLYSSKVDLWSIGVTFFVMIFGDYPFRSSNKEILRQKMISETGEKLFIPSEPPTSDECKDLLRRLIEPDVNRRLDWGEFYNHPLFKKSSESLEIVRDKFATIMLKSDIKKDRKLFEANREDSQINPELKFPEAYVNEQEEVSTDNSEGRAIEQADEVGDKELVIDRAKRRYNHQWKIIFFMIQTSENLGAVYNQKFLKSYSSGLIFAQLLLIKKAIILNDIVLAKMCKNDNIFDFEESEFNILVETHSDLGFILQHEEDKEEYSQNLTQALTQLGEDFTLSGSGKDPQAEKIQKLVSKQTASLADVAGRLRKQVFKLIKLLNRKRAKLSQDDGDRLAEVLARLYLCSEHEKEFIFKKSGFIFDWSELEQELEDKEYVEEILERALQD